MFRILAYFTLGLLLVWAVFLLKDVTSLADISPLFPQFQKPDSGTQQNEPESGDSSVLDAGQSQAQAQEVASDTETDPTPPPPPVEEVFPGRSSQTQNPLHSQPSSVRQLETTRILNKYLQALAYLEKEAAPDGQKP